MLETNRTKYCHQQYRASVLDATPINTNVVLIIYVIECDTGALPQYTHTHGNSLYSGNSSSDMEVIIFYTEAKTLNTFVTILA